MSRRVLAVVAHPDDEILGCGGTLARHVLHGDSCAVLILATGAMARPGQTDADIAFLRTCARRAAVELGVGELVFRDFPDNRLDDTPMLELVRSVEQTIDDFAPHVVYTHHPGDLNIDHGLVARAVCTATRPLAGDSPRAVYCFETLSATEWSFGTAGPAFTPDTFVDISATLEAKLRALAAYGPELRPFPHPRSREAVEALARIRGSQCGSLAAESFSTLRRIVGTTDPMPG